VASPIPGHVRHQLRARDPAKVLRIVSEAEDETPLITAGVTAGDDERKLRGIPCVARGAPGAIQGSDPVRALLAMNTGIKWARLDSNLVPDLVPA
jgi:hypothetical protein